MPHTARPDRQRRSSKAARAIQGRFATRVLLCAPPPLQAQALLISRLPDQARQVFALWFFRVRSFQVFHATLPLIHRSVHNGDGDTVVKRVADQVKRFLDPQRAGVVQSLSKLDEIAALESRRTLNPSARFELHRDSDKRF